MSTFVCSDTHVAFLVLNADTVKGYSGGPVHYFHAGETVEFKPQQVADLLRDANDKAYKEYYGRKARGAGKFDLRNVRTLPPFSALQMIKACMCLDYQCSDWSGWDTSEAKVALERIKEMSIMALPGWEGADWDIGD
jgi:hypothetical protein